jgi:hypothetical protein
VARALAFIGADPEACVARTPRAAAATPVREATASSRAGSAGPRWALAGLAAGSSRDAGVGRAFGLGPGGKIVFFLKSFPVQKQLQ